MHRGAQFVGHVGEKARLGDVGRLGGILGRPQIAGLLAHHLGELIAMPAQFLLGILERRNIGRTADEAEQRSVGPQNRIGCRHHPAIVTVGMPQAKLDAKRAPGFDALMFSGRAAHAVLRMNCLEPTGAEPVEQFGTGKLEPRAVEVGNPGIGCQHADQHRRGVGQASETGLGFPQRSRCTALIGDIGVGPDDTQRLPVVTAFDDTATIQHPDVAAIAMSHSMLGAIGLGMALEVILDRVRHLGNIVRVDPRSPFVEGGTDLAVPIPDHFAPARGIVDLVAGDVPVPDAFARTLQRELPARFAVAQRLFVASTLRNVARHAEHAADHAGAVPYGDRERLRAPRAAVRKSQRVLMHARYQRRLGGVVGLAQPGGHVRRKAFLVGATQQSAGVATGEALEGRIDVSIAALGILEPHHVRHRSDQGVEKPLLLGKFTLRPSPPGDRSERKQDATIAAGNDPGDIGLRIAARLLRREFEQLLAGVRQGSAGGVAQARARLAREHPFDRHADQTVRLERLTGQPRRRPAPLNPQVRTEFDQRIRARMQQHVSRPFGRPQCGFGVPRKADVLDQRPPPAVVLVAADSDHAESSPGRSAVGTGDLRLDAAPRSVFARHVGHQLRHLGQKPAAAGFDPRHDAFAFTPAQCPKIRVAQGNASLRIEQCHPHRRRFQQGLEAMPKCLGLIDPPSGFGDILDHADNGRCTFGVFDRQTFDLPGPDPTLTVDRLHAKACGKAIGKHAIDGTRQ